MIKDLFRRFGVNRAIIVADNDLPGLNGAKLLAEGLGISSCTLTLPCKDLREAVRLGVDKATIDSLARSAVWYCHHQS